ncbi:uncharacterized protein LOC121373462 [Gigantopelta aegis]|uniref:uncharacterized protein LOC121373462 n=1 Tax=Gigantopelta aegis TaxID=1735272 RepID=UPI001B88A7C8|nr:uncharacterized protein LOC121373462 [Gigantopelta aegis]
MGHLAADGPFENGHIVGQIDSLQLDEASGLAASRRHPGYLYSHNDHGGKNRLFMINAQTARVEAILTIKNANNHDWEDIAVGPCNGGSCIFIGDIGEGSRHSANTIYRVLEPDNVTDTALDVNGTYRFSWEEKDSETLMVDVTGNMFIVSKVIHGAGKLARLPSSGWDQPNPVIITPLFNLHIRTSHHDPMAGDISPDGTEILIKAKNHVFYWSAPDRDVEKALRNSGGTEVAYHREVLGESVAFSADGGGYYTLGEGQQEPLYFYKKK